MDAPLHPHSISCSNTCWLLIGSLALASISSTTAGLTDCLRRRMRPCYFTRCIALLACGRAERTSLSPTNSISAGEFVLQPQQQRGQARQLANNRAYACSTAKGWSLFGQPVQYVAGDGLDDRVPPLEAACPTGRRSRKNATTRWSTVYAHAGIARATVFPPLIPLPLVRRPARRCQRQD